MKSINPKSTPNPFNPPDPSIQLHESERCDTSKASTPSNCSPASPSHIPPSAGFSRPVFAPAFMRGVHHQIKNQARFSGASQPLQQERRAPRTRLVQIFRARVRTARTCAPLPLLITLLTCFASPTIQAQAPTPVPAAHATTQPLKLKLPFPSGHTYEVIQGNHGDYTHTGLNEYAWDFALPENAPVSAAAAGRVVRVKQDGTSGGPSNEYFSDGNAIIIDHGAGYYSQYLHLAANSAAIREGDLVTGGQIIARSGNTGFSSTPHLHFHVQDASGKSIPVKFQDVPGDGIPAPGARVTSANDGAGTAQYAGQSFLPPDIFSNNSILLLTRNLPGHLFRAGRDYQVKGRLTKNAARQVAIYFMSASGGDALYTTYAKIDGDGFFEATFDPAKIRKSGSPWQGDATQSNMYSLAIAPVKADGSFWSDVSVPVCVR